MLHIRTKTRDYGTSPYRSSDWHVQEFQEATNFSKQTTANYIEGNTYIHLFISYNCN